MLSSGRIDGFMGYEVSWDYLLKNSSKNNIYKKSPSLGSSFEYVAASKNNPRGQKMLKAFDLGREKLVENGKLKAIQNKWFNKVEINIKP